MSWKICLFTPTLEMGGTERVVSILSNQFSRKEGIEVHLVLCSNKPIFYPLNPAVVVHVPDFDYKSFTRFQFTFRLMHYLRNKAKQIQPDCFLSFGGRYNSFSILALAGKGIPVFISDRSKPGISYGKLLDFLNPIIYKFSAGIIAQTKLAAELTFKKTNHRKIVTIGNPVSNFSIGQKSKQKVILNVGRFIPSKNQIKLIRIFSELPDRGWELWFIGDGPEMNKCEQAAKDLGLGDRVRFLGKQDQMQQFYSAAAIFAFISDSEGFPNALGEAMTASCACISYDCVAGPSDLIEDGKTGFLIPVHNESAYFDRLNQMTEEGFDLYSLGEAAKISMGEYSEEAIFEKIYTFIRYCGN